MTRTSIEWATDSWNPIAAYDRETGKRGWFCTKVSAGCTHCYAEKFNRLRGNGHLYRVGNLDKVEFQLAPTLMDPLHWRKPRRVFVNSMTDLFLEAHTDEMIDQVFAVMQLAPQHEFLVLTKRPERMRDYFRHEQVDLRVDMYVESIAFEASDAHARRHDDLRAIARDEWPPRNFWPGVSVENQEAADERIPLLMGTPVDERAFRFLSCEPLLGPLELPLDDIAWRDADGRQIDWVIVGGESGLDARPCDTQWIRDVISECSEFDAACFVKQMGSRPTTPDLTHWKAPAKLLPDSSGYSLKLRDNKGGDPAEWPMELRVREYPEAALV